ncbi:MAG: Hpt domain-containing protein [Epsilonproteobacteria bacterium]|nr:MAG: Hpt domain-containing protein [Campylobacterota bacterium]
MSINRDEIAQQLGFRREDIDMLINMFCKNAAVSLEQMKQMITDGNLNGIADAAHAIKGSAGNLKLDSIYTLAYTVEMQAKSTGNENFETLYLKLKDLIKTL